MKTKSKYIGVNIPLVYVRLLSETAAKNDRTISAEIRVILREWASQQQATAAAATTR